MTSAEPGSEQLEDTPPGQWVPDVLEGFERLTIPLGLDEDGTLSATLIRPVREPGREDKIPVLYLHGWSDYFYNAPLAAHFESHGYAFYALDLRRYGRSMRPGQTPGWIDNLETYDDEIGMAFHQIAQEVPELPVLMGHSTGGLTASLWAARHPGRIRALVLNSPWLEMQGSTPVRLMANTVLEPVSRVNPRSILKLPKVDNYWRSISSAGEGEWDLHSLWRPPLSFDVPRGWLTAVMAGHAKVQAGLHLQIPVYVMLAEKTHFGVKFSEAYYSSDTVLDVEVLAQRATKLGRQVTVVRHHEAMHDVMASRPAVRRQAAREMFRWLATYAGPGTLPGQWSDPLIPDDDNDRAD